MLALRTIVVLCLVLAARHARAQAPRPNIVLVLADDMGWTDVSGGRTNMGHRSDYYRTPHLDALAARGMAFDNAYSCGPNCAPTRAALMSGQYAPRTGVYTVGNPNRGKGQFRKLEAAPNSTTLEPKLVTLAETLRKAGYATGHFGKWHLGNDPARGPVAQGFAHNAGGTARGAVSGGSSGHFARADGSFNLPNLPANKKPYQFMADRLTDEAIAFMDRNKAKPFFAYVTHFSVHTPTQAPAADIKAFDNIPKGKRHKNQTYAGMLKNLDDNLGRIVGWLEATKLIRNTVVIFYADNGGVGGYADAGISGGKEITNQFPLKAGKGSLYEGGIRVPLIVRWDGKVAPRVCSVPVTSVDFQPTLAALAGVSPPSQPLDGANLVPLLTGKAKSVARDALYWHFPAYLEASAARGTWRTTPVSVIRRGRWKLLFYYEARRPELYDLATDIGEQRNVAAQQPALVRSLSQQLTGWLVRTGASMPRFKGTTTPVPYPLTAARAGFATMFDPTPPASGWISGGTPPVLGRTLGTNLTAPGFDLAVVLLGLGATRGVPVATANGSVLLYLDARALVGAWPAGLSAGRGAFKLAVPPVTDLAGVDLALQPAFLTKAGAVAAGNLLLANLGFDAPRAAAGFESVFQASLKPNADYRNALGTPARVYANQARSLKLTLTGDKTTGAGPIELRSAPHGGGVVLGSIAQSVASFTVSVLLPAGGPGRPVSVYLHNADPAATAQIRWAVRIE